MNFCFAFSIDWASSLTLYVHITHFTHHSKLEYYGLFKQATVGDVDCARPGMFSFEAKAKWDAWDAVKGLTKDAAMAKYVEIITEDNPKWAEWTGE